jgi:uncharacterized protein (TIGR00159 family)
MGALIPEMISWREVLDVVLIAMGIFLLYRTLSRLGSWKIVLGIFISVAVLIAANLLNLEGIRWIYSNLSNIALLALIVIFQPEIRKILERAASLKRFKTGDYGSEAALLIANAVVSLAERKWGALLVFPGKEPIQQWTAGGVSLNAEPSFPLLMSIFDPHSPGHDGALIIENGMLTRFGVRLPMSKTGRLPEEFGTRHHAAMGMSEVTDSLVLAVSEERGSVMTFHHGMAKKIQNKTEIIENIRSHLENIISLPHLGAKGKRRWMLLSEIIISVALAFFFWSTVIVSQGELREKAIIVPVEYTATPPDIALAGDQPTEIKLHLSGPKSDLDTMNPSQVSVKVDLSKVVPGKKEFLITEENIQLPKRVELLDVEPAKLVLSFKALVAQEATVKPQLLGRLSNGMILEAIEVKPKKIKVLATASGKGRDTISIMTSQINLESITESTRLYCKVIAPPGVRPADAEWPEIEVFIRVKSPPEQQ